LVNFRGLTKILGKLFNFFKVGDNFIVLQAAFKRENPESTKNTDDYIAFFALLGSSRLKVTRKMLVKLTHGKSPWLVWISLIS